MAEIPPEVQARLGDPKNTEEASIDELKAILKEYYDRSIKQWHQEYSYERAVAKKNKLG